MIGMIEICFAKANDEPKILQFLHDHWRADHIFVTNPVLMRWQHESPDSPGDKLTFVIARRINADDSSEILALLGFIPFRRFDSGADWSELSLAIWKVSEDAGTPGLGLQLLKTIQRELQPSLICAIGTSQIVRPIYTALGYTVGALSHVALFLETVPSGETVALGVPDVARRSIAEDQSVALQPVFGGKLPAGITAADIDILAAKGLPRKSWTYILNRYVQHPYYEYEIRTVIVGGALRSILIWRRVSTQYGNILRIVDVIGDADVLVHCGPALRREVAASESEYIDLMHWGVSPEALSAGGFVGLHDYKDLVLPAYFEPFEQRNVQIEIAYRVDAKLSDRRLRLFRADSDQDRPNQPQLLMAKGTNNEH